ncbi:MAG: hypothetical protein Q7S03_00605 [bacterium]|nr:hypothetical protein [bacterium]
MFAQIAYFPFLGKPLIVYLGMLTLTSFMFTALIGFLNFRSIYLIPFKWHPRMALISISLGIIHGSIGMGVYFFG